jgi:hypothetical protein
MKGRVILGTMLAVVLAGQAWAQEWDPLPAMSGSLSMTQPTASQIIVPNTNTSFSCTSSVTDSDTRLVCPFDVVSDTVTLTWRVYDSQNQDVGSWVNGINTGTSPTWHASAQAGEYYVKVTASDGRANDDPIVAGPRTIYVAGLVSLSVSPDHPGLITSKHYAAHDENGHVTITPVFYPSGYSPPANEISWSRTPTGNYGSAQGASYILYTKAPLEYGVTATWTGTWGSQQASITVVVIQVTDLDVDPASPGQSGHTYYSTKATVNDDVTLTVSVAPEDVDLDDLRVSPADSNAVMTFSGGEAGADKLQRTLNRGTPTSGNFTLICGDYAPTSVTVYVCELTGLTADGNLVEDQDGTYHVSRECGQITIHATMDPSSASASDLPDNFVHWGVTEGYTSWHPMINTVNGQKPNQLQLYLLMDGCSSPCTVKAWLDDVNDFVSVAFTPVSVTAAELEVENAQEGQTEGVYYASKQTSGYVVVRLALTPAIPAANMGGAVTWSITRDGGAPTGATQVSALEWHLPRQSAATWVVHVTCGTFDETVTIYVVQGELGVSGADLGQQIAGDTWYAWVAATGEVTVTATLTPDVTLGDLPDEFFVFDGRNAVQGNAKQFTLPKTESASVDYSLTVGGVETDLTVKVVEVVDPPGLDVDNAEQGLITDTWYAAQNSGDVTLSITLTPSVDGTDLPANLVQWTEDGLPVTPLLNRLQWKVPTASTGSTHVGVTAGSFQDAADITVVGPGSPLLAVAGPVEGVTVAQNHNYYAVVCPDVPQSHSVTVTFTLVPGGLDAADLPANVYAPSFDNGVTVNGFTCLVPKDEAASYDISVMTGQSSAVAHVYVVTPRLTASGTLPGIRPLTEYCRVDAGVTINLDFFPSVGLNDLPAGFASWVDNGVISGQGAFARSLVTSSAGWKQPAATCQDDYDTAGATLDVAVVAVTGLLVNWEEVGDDEYVYFEKTEDGFPVFITAIVTPADLDYFDLPENLIQWSGDDDHYLLDAWVLTRETDVREVTATCGSSSKSVNIVVYDLTLDVSGPYYCDPMTGEPTGAQLVPGEEPDVYYVACDPDAFVLIHANRDPAFTIGYGGVGWEVVLDGGEGLDGVVGEGWGGHSADEYILFIGAPGVATITYHCYATFAAQPSDVTKTVTIYVLDVDPEPELDVEITSPASVACDVGDTVEITAEATPDPADLMTAKLYWYVISEDGADGTFDPNDSGDATTTEFTATSAGTGYIVVEYWFNGNFATDSIPLTITGVTIREPVVCALGETVEVSASCHPAGGTYTWWVTGDADGEFDEETNGTEDGNPIEFLATDPGFGTVHLSYEVGEDAFTDDAPLVVLALAPDPSSIEADPEDEIALDAGTIPAIGELEGATLCWWIEDWWGGDPPMLVEWCTTTDANTLLTCGPGEGTLMIAYEYCGASYFAEVPITVSGIAVTVTPEALSLAVTQYEQLHAVGYPESGIYTWSIAQGSVATGTFDTDEPYDEANPLFTAGATPGEGTIICTYTLGAVSAQCEVPFTVAVDETGPGVCVVSFEPEVLSEGVVEIVLQFTDDLSGVDTEVAPCLTLKLSDDSELEVEGSFDLETPGQWIGYVEILEEDAEGPTTIVVSGAMDKAGNEMEEAEFDGPVIDHTPPDAEEFTVENNGDEDHDGLPDGDEDGEGDGGDEDGNGKFYVSPAYVKGYRPVDAVDVLWRYQGQTTWHSVQADVDAQLDAVVADKWWWCEIPLDYKLSGGQTSNVTNAQRHVMIELAGKDAAGNISTPVEVMLVWAVTHIGDENHLIQKGEKMILSGPGNPGELPPGDKTLTVSGPDLNETKQGAYVSTSMPNWLATFNTEGFDRTYTATITEDADPHPPEVIATTKIHVIKKLHVEVIKTVAQKPSGMLEWFEFYLDLIGVQLPWVVNAPQGATYAVVKVPRSDSKSSWATYELRNGTRLDNWLALLLGLDLWWSDPIPADKWLETRILVTYDGCELAHDSLGLKPWLMQGGDDGDDGELSEILLAYLLIYQDEGARMHSLYGKWVGCLRVAETDKNFWGNPRDCQTDWYQFNGQGRWYCTITIRPGMKPMVAAKKLFSAIDDAIHDNHAAGLLATNCSPEDWLYLYQTSFARGAATAAFLADVAVSAPGALNPGYDGYYILTIAAPNAFQALKNWIMNWNEGTEAGPGYEGGPTAGPGIQGIGYLVRLFKTTTARGVELRVLLTSATAAMGSMTTSAGGKIVEVTVKALENCHAHHIWFKCLGGSDDAANLIKIEAIVHTGKNVSLHRHILQEMRKFSPRAGSWQGLPAVWRELQQAKNVEGQWEFVRSMRGAYESYFAGSPHMADIMAEVDKAFALVKIVE